MQTETNQTPPNDECLSTREAADYIGFSERTFIRWRNAGEGPPYCRVGGKIVYLRSDLSAHLKSNRVVPVRAQAAA